MFRVLYTGFVGDIRPRDKSVLSDVWFSATCGVVVAGTKLGMAIRVIAKPVTRAETAKR